MTAPAFESWLAFMRRRAALWHAQDFQRLHREEGAIARAAPDDVASRVIEFCERSGGLVQDLGADEVGRLVWHVLGSPEATWHEVAKAAAPLASSAVLSLRGLYQDAFAPNLTSPDDQTTGVSSRLGTACYMLWDMDSGLDGFAFGGKPEPLADACFVVLSHALALESPSCWLSALHGLGHLVMGKTHDRAVAVIDAFTAARGDVLPPHLLHYARAARSGCVQ
jgi:hypothetical protein